MSRRRERKQARKAKRLARERRAGLEATRRQFEKGMISQEDLEELEDFWENAEEEAIFRAWKTAARDAGRKTKIYGASRPITRGVVRVLGRKRKGGP